MHNLKNGTRLMPPAAGPTHDQRLKAARDRYCNAINEALDAELEAFILPTDRVAMLEDAANFAAFLIVTKIADAMRVGVGKHDLIRIWNKLHKQMNREIPATVLEFAKAADAEAKEQPNG